MRRLVYITLGMVAFFLGSFLLADALGYGDPELWESWLRGLGASEGGVIVAAVAVVLMLVVDLLLPVPSSVIMTASGVMLGPLLGGLVSFFGAMGAAILGFWACRLGGHRWARRIVGEKDLERTRQWFDRWGVVAIVISRPIPMLTEVLSCLAGLTDFSFRTFLLASILGTLPICFVYSVVGSYGSLSNPLPAVIVAVAIPAIGWFVARKVKGVRR